MRPQFCKKIRTFQLHGTLLLFTPSIPPRTAPHLQGAVMVKLHDAGATHATVVSPGGLVVLALVAVQEVVKTTLCVEVWWRGRGVVLCMDGLQ